MAGEEAQQKKVRTRSPAYPYLALPEALERSNQLRRAEGRHAVSVAVAMQHWGYKAESSTGYSCIAALKKFGLVDEEGSGENREVRLSSLALAILLDNEEGSAERAAALRTAALSPRIHAELWERYGPELPSDQTLRRFLLLERNFNEASVDEFITEYRETIAFAKLTETSGEPHAFAPLPSPRPARAAGAAKGGAERTNGPVLPGLEPKESPPAVQTVLEEGPAKSRQMDPEPALKVATALEDVHRELPVPLDHDMVARVPYPMTEESFDLLVDTLQLWKKRLVRPTK